MQRANVAHGRPTQRGPSEVATAIQPAKEAAAKLNRVAGRFEVYDYLKAVYRIYRGWRYRKIAKRSARLLAGELSITRRKSTSSIRVLIEATMPGADLRQKSRWVRALEYISSEDIPTREFRKFVRVNGGLAGCARLAVRLNRRRRRPRRDCVEGDWDD
jgi:hypothetical protein